MGLFDKFKEITRKVSEVESNIYHEKRDYLEIYERNIELEARVILRARHGAVRRRDACIGLRPSAVDSAH